MKGTRVLEGTGSKGDRKCSLSNWLMFTEMLVVSREECPDVLQSEEETFVSKRCPETVFDVPDTVSAAGALSQT